MHILIRVRDHRPEKEREICAALDHEMKVFEGAWDLGEPACHLTKDGPEIRSRTRMAVIINRPLVWEPKFREAVAAGVIDANGAPCIVDISIVDV